jgi:hypothetical protein
MTTFAEGVGELKARGWHFQHLTDDTGNVVTVIGSYAWPEEYYDRLHSQERADAIRGAIAEMSNPDRTVAPQQPPRPARRRTRDRRRPRHLQPGHR